MTDGSNFAFMRSGAGAGSVAGVDDAAALFMSTAACILEVYGEECVEVAANFAQACGRSTVTGEDMAISAKHCAHDFFERPDLEARVEAARQRRAQEEEQEEEQGEQEEEEEEQQQEQQQDEGEEQEAEEGEVEGACGGRRPRGPGACLPAMGKPLAKGCSLQLRGMGQAIREAEARRTRPALRPPAPPGRGGGRG